MFQNEKLNGFKKLPCIHIHGVEKVLLSLHYTPEDAADNLNLFLVVLAFIFFFVNKDIPECDRSTKTFSCKHENNNDNNNDHNNRYGIFFSSKTGFPNFVEENCMPYTYISVKESIT